MPSAPPRVDVREALEALPVGSRIVDWPDLRAVQDPSHYQVFVHTMYQKESDGRWREFEREDATDSWERQTYAYSSDGWWREWKFTVIRYGEDGEEYATVATA